MCGSGVRTGMAARAQAQRPIPRVQRVGLTACAVAAAGTALRGTAALPFATTTSRRIAPPISGSASPFPSNVFFSDITPTMPKLKKKKKIKKEKLNKGRAAG